MKALYVKAFLVGAALACTSALLDNCVPIIDQPRDNGIVILPGYQNAVAICGPAEYGYSDAVILKRNNHTLYINSGYVRDVEIEKLSMLANKHCKNLR